MKKDELLDLLNDFKPEDKYIEEVLNNDFSDISKARAGKARLTPMRIIAPIAACLAAAVGVRIAVSLNGIPFANLGGTNAPATANSAESQLESAVNSADSQTEFSKSKLESAVIKLESAQSSLESVEFKLKAAENELEIIKTSETDAYISELKADIKNAEAEREIAIMELETAKSEFENVAKKEISSCKQALSEKYSVPLDELKAATCDMKLFDLDGDGEYEVVFGFKDVPKLKGMYVFKMDLNSGNTEFVTELDPEGLRGYDHKNRDYSVNILKYKGENESFFYYHAIKVTYKLLDPGDVTYGERYVYKISANKDGSIAAEEFLYDGCQLNGRDMESAFRVNGSEVTFEEYYAVFDKYGFIKNIPTVESE